MPGSRASETERREQILAAAFRVAARKGLESMTVRDVAAEAKLSSGLVFFHFETKDALLLAMLDDLSAWVMSGRDQQEIGFVELLDSESNFEGEERKHLELLLEFMVFGAHRPTMQKRLRKAMNSYREMFLSPAQKLLQDKPLRKTTPESLAALGTSLIIGNALQTLLEPTWMETEKPLSAIEEMWGGISHPTVAIDS